VYGLLLGTKDSKKERTNYSAARIFRFGKSEATNYTRLKFVFHYFIFRKLSLFMESLCLVAEGFQEMSNELTSPSLSR